nr:MAG TPA: hypothetical protein [Caudoviricetes sp.]
MLNNIGFWNILQGVTPPLGGARGRVVTSQKFFSSFLGVFLCFAYWFANVCEIL